MSLKRMRRRCSDAATTKRSLRRITKLNVPVADHPEQRKIKQTKSLTENLILAKLVSP